MGFALKQWKQSHMIIENPQHQIKINETLNQGNRAQK